MLTHRLRHGRVAVTGQINHKMTVGQFKKIDMLRTAGRFRYIGQPNMVAQRIDRAGFARVGPSDKGYFGSRIGQIFQVVYRSKKFCVLK